MRWFYGGHYKLRWKRMTQANELMSRAVSIWALAQDRTLRWRGLPGQMKRYPRPCPAVGFSVSAAAASMVARPPPSLPPTDAAGERSACPQTIQTPGGRQTCWYKSFPTTLVMHSILPCYHPSSPGSLLTVRCLPAELPNSLIAVSELILFALFPLPSAWAHTWARAPSSAGPSFSSHKGGGLQGPGGAPAPAPHECPLMLEFTQTPSHALL